MYTLAQVTAMREVALIALREARAAGRLDHAEKVSALGAALDGLRALLQADAEAARLREEANRADCTLCRRQVRNGEPATFVVGEGWHHDRCAA